MKLGERIGGGNTADIYAWGSDQILKVFHDPKLLEMELEVSTDIAALAVGAPAFYGIVEEEGLTGLAYERIMGPSMLEMLVDKPEMAEECGRDRAEGEITFVRLD